MMIKRPGYNVTELTEAVNKTISIPPVTTVELYKVLYRCETAQSGVISGNSLCIAGCISMGTGNQDDQCAM